MSQHFRVWPRDSRLRSLRFETLEDRRLLAVVTVDTNQDVVDFNDGVTSLREAIFATNLVSGADEIQFDFGHEDPETILLTMGELAITDSLTITGPGAELLTIDANQQSRLLNVEGTAVDVTLSGLTLKKGRTVGDNPSSFDTTYNGGGIRFRSDGTLILENSALSDNSTAGDYAAGGGIHASLGNVVLIASSVSGNKTEGHAAAGGGIASYFDVTLIDSTIQENRTTGDNARGGGILTIRGDVTLTNSTVSTNTTWGDSADGGGIVTLRGDVTLSDSTVTGNSTMGAGADGGGITSGNLISGLPSTGTVTIANSTVSGNSTAGDFARGGGIHSVVAVTIESSTVSGNSTAGLNAQGGGIFSRTGDVSITDSTLSRNSTQGEDSDGGGIFVANDSSNASLTIHRSILADNTVANGSQGPDFVPDPEAVLDVTHSLIGYNTGSYLSEAPVGSPDANGNLIGGPIHGVIDPLLGPLANSGGPTLTHALLLGSPAINAGDLSAVAGVDDVPLFDQRGTGFDRVFSGRIDIGAYEIQEFSDLNLLVDTLQDESDGDYSRYDLSLREAIELANAIPVHDTIHFDPILTATLGPLPPTILLTMGELAITDDLTINGLGADQLTIDASGNDPTPDENNGDGSRIFNIDDGDNSTSIDVELRGLSLTGSDAPAKVGGAIASRENLSVVASTISGNSVRDVGGGIWATRGRMTTIIDSTISGNSASLNGGGVYSFGKTTITDSTISDNSADGSGGGIYVRSRATITGSTFLNNSAVLDGGGIWVSSLDSLANSTIADNSADGNGGGIYLDGFQSPIENTTISGNSAKGHGGGIFVNAQSNATSINHSTIALNSADTDGDSNGRGGGIYVFRGVVKMNHTIVADNTRYDHSIDEDIAADPDDPQFSFRDTNGLIETIAAGTAVLATNTIIGLDPQLGTLADNGGPTLPNGAVIQTHALLPGSPALNAGNPDLIAGVDGTPLQDQRGFPWRRISGGRIDIGAFESQPLPGDFDLDGDVDSDDRVVWEASYGVNNKADADGDGQSSGADFLIWQMTRGMTINALVQEAQVAEAEVLAASDPLPETPLEPRLVDLAMAVELLGDSPNTPVRSRENSFPDVARDEVFLRTERFEPRWRPAEASHARAVRHALNARVSTKLSDHLSDGTEESWISALGLATRDS